MPARALPTALHRRQSPLDDEGREGAESRPTASLQRGAEAEAPTVHARAGGGQVPRAARWKGADLPHGGNRVLADLGSEPENCHLSQAPEWMRDAGGHKPLALGKSTGSRLQPGERRHQVTKRVSDSGCLALWAEGQPGVQRTRSVSMVQLQSCCGRPLPAVLWLGLGLGLEAMASRSCDIISEGFSGSRPLI